MTEREQELLAAYQRRLDEALDLLGRFSMIAAALQRENDNLQWLLPERVAPEQFSMLAREH